MIEPDAGCKVHQAWNKKFNNNLLKEGDVLEDILMPRQEPFNIEEKDYYKRWRFRLWRAKVISVGIKTIDFGVPGIYIIRPDDERVLDYIKNTYMPHESELE